MTALHELDLLSAGAALRRAELSSLELTRALLARIDSLNPRLNAFVEVTHERALEDAARADAERAAGRDRGPLHGMPIALKDLIDTAGIRTAAGSGIYRDRVPAADATVAARLREAGAVLLGKTNTHELAFGITTHNPHFGPSKNPWDVSRTPGGSSGGSAVAVAARLVLAALGTDTGGSTRIPAALCGCIGLKPTFGLVPTTGIAPMSFIGDHVGTLTRTVADAALVLDAIAGDDPADANALPMPLPALADALASRDLRGLRLGVPRATMWRWLDPEVAAAAESALGVLRELGAKTCEIDLPDVMPVLGLPGSLGYFSFVLEESRQAHRAARALHPSGLGPELVWLYGMPELPGSLLVQALEAVREYAVAVRRALATVDLLVAPTVPVPAPPLDVENLQIGPATIPFIAVGLSNTAPFNMARVPALSIPCGFTRGGLPIGLQLAGRSLAEATLLRAAAAYQAATPWTEPAPRL
jgi:aspartyl-tRNA(Asn)/glutamyl-tRNA(Gln) amidotransferase subunit A